MRLHAVLCSLVALGAMTACGGDDDAPGSSTTSGTTNVGGSAGEGTGGTGDTGGTTSSGGSAGEGTGGTGGTTSTTGSAAGGAAGMSGGAGEGGAPVDPEVARGEYLVNVVSVCTDCHTPRNPDGSPDMDNYLAGVECFVDADPADADVGCLSSRNLTNDETGLKNRSDEEIKNMFLSGLRPNGDALHPIMPYWSYGNMTEEDADAIVAFLRTVQGVEHELPPNQAPFLPPAEPAVRVDLDEVPEPDSSEARYESAMRGRYLAAQAGVCLECHTPETEPGTPEPRDLSLAFSGGSMFARDALGLPPVFPEEIYTRNLTSDATGLADWTRQDIVRLLKEGMTPDDTIACPPMPAGPMGAYARLTDEDALDIATYLKWLPPIATEEWPDCEVPQ